MFIFSLIEDGAGGILAILFRTQPLFSLVNPILYIFTNFSYQLIGIICLNPQKCDKINRNKNWCALFEMNANEEGSVIIGTGIILSIKIRI